MASNRTHSFYVEVPEYLQCFFSKEPQYLDVAPHSVLSTSIFFAQNTVKKLKVSLPENFDPSTTESYFSETNTNVRLSVTPALFLYLQEYSNFVSPKIVKILKRIFIERILGYVKGGKQGIQTSINFFFREYDISSVEHLNTVYKIVKREIEKKEELLKV